MQAAVSKLQETAELPMGGGTTDPGVVIGTTTGADDSTTATGSDATTTTTGK